MGKIVTKRRMADIGFEVAGSLLIALGIYNFAVEAQFPMTGFSGISIILYRLLGMPIGMSTILLNIPVALCCYKLLGRGFFLRSIRCMVISSLCIDYVAPLLPTYQGDRMLAALCTGVLAGLGYAIIYLRKSSTGGSDFIILSVKALKPYLSLGKIAFLSDVLIVLAGGILFRDVDGIIYGMLINFLLAVAVDKVMYGISAGKLALIVTQDGSAMCQAIDRCCGRGSTILQGQGGYQQEEKQVVLCACNNKQMHLVQQAAKAQDPASFVIVLESNEVLGEGFHRSQVGERG